VRFYTKTRERCVLLCVCAWPEDWEQALAGFPRSSPKVSTSRMSQPVMVVVGHRAELRCSKGMRWLRKACSTCEIINWRREGMASEPGRLSSQMTSADMQGLKPASGEGQAQQATALCSWGFQGASKEPQPLGWRWVKPRGRCRFPSSCLTNSRHMLPHIHTENKYQTHALCQSNF